MSKNENSIIQEEVVKEILKKARDDKAFKKMLFDNPQEALGQFDIQIPDATADFSMKDRRMFYTWFYKSILNELRDETDAVAPGLCDTAAEHVDVDWDFEVTKYDSK
jgi:hypothetical protein